MAEANAGLELPIGLTEQKFMKQLAKIEADAIRTANRAEAAFKKSNQSSARSFAALERSSQRSLRGMQQLFKIGGGLLAGGAVAQQVKQFLRLSDAYTKMQNSLRVVGLEGNDLNDVYGRLFQSAQRNSAPVSSLVDLYSKLALTQKELGVSSDELIQFTDGIAVALKVAGTDSVAASGSLLQLSQALGGGVVRAEEFNSILEGTPTIAQAVARGLKEAGGSVAELRRLVVNGEVSSTAFFRAFEAGSSVLRDQAASSQSTVGQSFTRLGNSIVTIVGEFDKATGASDAFAESIDGLANGLEDFDASGFVSKVQGIIEKLGEAERAGTAWLNSIGNAQVFKDLNEYLGYSENGMAINPDVGEAQGKIAALEKEVESLQAQIENNTSLGFDNTEAIARLNEVRSTLASLRAEAANITRYVNVVYGPNMDTGKFFDGSSYKPPTPVAKSEPVSIKDHPAAPSKSKGGGGRKGRGGGSGGGRKEKTAADIIGVGEDDARDIERAIRLIGLSASETAKLEAQWAMLDAAKKEGIPVNDKLNAQIEAQASKVAQLTDQLKRAEISQDRFDEAIEGISGAFTDALVAGESLREGLARVFKQIASDILNAGIQNALKTAFSGAGQGGGFWGLLAGAFGGTKAATPSFDGGGFTGMGSRSGGIDGKGGFPAILHPNETVLDHSRGQGAGGRTNITIDVRGATGNQEIQDMVARGVSAGMSQVRGEVPGIMDKYQKRWK